MNAINELSESLSEQQAEIKPIPFVAGIASPLATSSVNLLDAADGLLAVQDVRLSNATSIFVTYWATREHFMHGRSSVFAALNASSVAFEGTTGKLRIPPKPKWRVKFSTVLLSSAALLGALEVISNRYERIFASPELAVLSEKPIFNLIELEDFTTAVTIENLLSVAEHRNILVTATLTESGQERTRLIVQDAKMSSLPASKAREFRVIGKAPSAGSYQMRIDVQSEAGWVRAAKSFTTQSQVKIWPRNPQAYLGLKQAGSSVADYVVFVEVGHATPNGIVCDLTISGAGRINFDRTAWRSIESTTLGKYLVAGSGLGTTSRLRWSWASVGAQKSLKAELTLMGDSGTNWEALAKKSKIECTPLKEKSDVVI